jgi:ubiquinone/menaquinone biosynthesis C-methylase UbiE
MGALPRNLVVRWMPFASEGDRIVALRRRVQREQGQRDESNQNPHDQGGLHLGAFDNGALIAVTSVYLFDDATEPMQSYGLPTGPWRVAQYVQCVTLPAYRETAVTELLMATLARMVYEVLRPRYAFFLHPAPYIPSETRCVPDLGWEVHGAIQGEETEISVLQIPPGEPMEAAFRRARTISEPLWEQLEVLPQSIVKYLHDNGQIDLVERERSALFLENMYSAAISLTDELPRLSAQTRLLFTEQKPRVEAVDFPKPPATLLDVGAGPGVYLAALGKTEKFKGYELVGLDSNKEMVMYARLNRSDIKWLHTTAYETQMQDESIDVVHLNFVLQHLVSPAFALREFRRILRPGGLLYIADVNDSTFAGPAAMKALIDAHHDLFTGDRNVLNWLPRLALEWGFELRHSFSTAVRNIGTSPALEFLPDEVRVDRIKMWGLFSFLGQREELAVQLKEAHEIYFASLEESRIHIQTHVYRKST